MFEQQRPTTKNISTPEKPRARKSVVKKPTSGFSFGQSINLIPQDKEAKVRSTQRSVVSHLLASAFLAFAVVAVAYGGLYIYGYVKEQELSAIAQERVTVDQSISSIEGHRTALVQFQNTLEKLKDVLTNHIRWTRFFAVLENYTLPDVTYTNVVLSPQGKIRLSGLAKDYTTLARQLKAFEGAKDVFSEVSIPSGHAILNQSGSTVGVSFDASLTLLPSVLTSITQ